MVASRRAGLATALAALATAFPTAVRAGWEQVPVAIPVPPAIDVPAGDTILVAMFRANDHERIDVGLEIARWVRRELARRTSFDVLDVPPPPIPEQRPEHLAVNDVFWKQLGADYGADLIVAGVARFGVEDRSGFASYDTTDPVTQQTVRRTRYVERTAYSLRIEIFFLKGDNGALLHDDIWTDERVVAAEGQEDLQNLFDLLESMRDDLLSVLLPTTVDQPRHIWVE